MKMTETRLESKDVFEGRIIKVRVDKVLLPNGKESTREVVVHRGAVAIVPILDERRVLLVRQFRYPVGEVLLEIPAGTISDGEDPERCALRELEEETGYLGDLSYLCTLFLAPGYSTERIHLFIATNLKRTKQNPDEDEILELVEMTIEEAISMIGDGRIRDAKTVAGLILARERICKG
jgi:ADP-ribose pyrophosphatase